MLLPALIAAGHFIAAFALVAALAMEWSLLRGRIDGAVVGRLLRADLVYGVSAFAVLLFGLCRVMWFEKPADYYVASMPFWIKLAAFALIGLLSVKPTFALLRARRAARDDEHYAMPAGEAAMLRCFIQLELALLLPVVLAASLMAKGIGVIA